jgi:hypothetical protein
VAWFYRTILKQPPTKAALIAPTKHYVGFVEAYARKRGLTLEWAPKGVRKEDWVVYAILMSMEQGQSFRVVPSRRDPNKARWNHLESHWSRYRHYYFYIYDPVLGACSLRIGSFLPYVVTAWINGHEFIARRLTIRKVAFTQRDNSITACNDLGALQRAAQALSPNVIGKRLNYWAWAVGPKIARKHLERLPLRRQWFVQQAEYALNLIFEPRQSLRRLFERSCELSLLRLSADGLSQIFGAPRRRQLSGKWQLVLERLQGAQHVFRAYWRHSFLKQYEKWCRFVRFELTTNRTRDLGVAKSLNNWKQLRHRMRQSVERFAQRQAQTFNVHGEFDLLARLAKPVQVGKTKVGGIRLEQPRPMRLLELLLRAEAGGWTLRELHHRLLQQYQLRPSTYSLGALRYDVRKLRAHGLITRIGRSYRWRLTQKGHKVALLVTLFRKRVYGPLAHSTFVSRPDPQHSPDCRLERAYHKVDAAIDELVHSLAA